jgi:hypothetical protein
MDKAFREIERLSFFAIPDYFPDYWNKQSVLDNKMD